MVLFLTEAHHIPVVTAGFLLALMQVAGAFARIGLGFVSDRLFDGERKSVFLSCCILTGFLSLIIAGMPRGISIWILAIIIFLWGFVALGWAALHLTMMGEFAGAESAGLATGVINLFTTPGIIFGPPLFGYIVDVTGSYALAWSLSGTICFASTLIIGLTREERKRI
ncbi:MAG: MFS transporter [Nitrososphaeria archaeon]|nr:MFS transporter [Nitrososphaeria archaeon]NIQ33167.1 MFS transporter [Nitrososphaeria archaeon]